MRRRWVALAGAHADGSVPRWFGPPADALDGTALVDGFAFDGARRGNGRLREVRPAPAVVDGVDHSADRLRPSIVRCSVGMAKG